MKNITAKYIKQNKKMEKKVLTLTIKKQWFDMIVSGEKTEDYRVIKTYWMNRFLQHAKEFTHALFINGHRKDSPRIEKEIESITIGKPKKGLCPNEWLGTYFFVIKLKTENGK